MAAEPYNTTLHYNNCERVIIVVSCRNFSIVMVSEICLPTSIKTLQIYCNLFIFKEEYNQLLADKIQTLQQEVTKRREQRLQTAVQTTQQGLKRQ